MIKTSLLFLLCVCVGISHGAVFDAAETRQWTEWKARYGKRYSTIEEDSMRRTIWTKNRAMIEAHNREYEAGLHTYQQAMNAFGDQVAEKNRRPLVIERAPRIKLGEPSSRRSWSRSGEPVSWDWRPQGKVNPVRNQGEVNSALAINVADAVASFSAIKNITQPSELSDQELIDCCLPDPIMDPTVFDCIKTIGGLCADGTYHSGSGGNPCNNGSCKAVATVTNGGSESTSGDELALLDAVLQTPVVVGIDASQMSFQLYSSGIYSDPSCSTTELDHSLLVVGYGVDGSSGLEYWICRNTWGASWGMDGYINIARDKDNMCGIATSPIYPY